jgi:hypothetical protein
MKFGVRHHGNGAGILQDVSDFRRRQSENNSKENGPQLENSVKGHRRRQAVGQNDRNDIAPLDSQLGQRRRKGIGPVAKPPVRKRLRAVLVLVREKIILAEFFNVLHSVTCIIPVHRFFSK